MAFYNVYRVHGSTCSATFYFIAPVDTEVTPFRCHVQPSNSSGFTEAIGVQDRSLRTYTRWKHGGNSHDTKAIVRVKNYMSTKRMFGLKSIDQEDDFTGTSTAGPNNPWYWVTGCSTVDDSNISISLDIRVIVDFTFYVEFCKIKKVGIS